MVHLVFCCRRRPELSHEQYVERLLHGHVPLALRHHPTMRRYVVNVVDESPAGWGALDSIGELAFDTLDDYRERLYDSPAGEAAVARDVAGFLGGADAWATTAHVHREPARTATGLRSPGVKLVCPIVRRDGLTHEAFVEHWLGRHVPLALRHHPGLVRYATLVVERPLSGDAPALDGIAQLTFASPEAAGAACFDSPEGERLIREDMARFIGRTGAYRVGEYVQR